MKRLIPILVMPLILLTGCVNREKLKEEIKQELKEELKTEIVQDPGKFGTTGKHAGSYFR